MKKIIELAMGILMLISFTSCFEIVEEVDMNKDGSGKLLLTINASESKQNLANYSQMKDFQGMPIPSRNMVEEELDKALQILKKQPGISNVQMTKDFKEFVFTLTGQFKNTTALNNAVNTLVKELNPRAKTQVKRVDNFKTIKNTFQRLYPFPTFAERYEKVPFLYQALLESARYVTIQRFQKPIRNKTNQDYKVADNKRAVFMKTSLADLIKGEKTLANKVTF